uniref:Uncharacterized protein n=1 Tax=Strombidium rassoulzadegani TaxID=1082188 RepID=A0A7S3CJC2_9SPIT|mmetsp:Transcript_13110/g.22133  ORF Transcript_13110/g.22133 Transcript_13110/m.22133 type:complete len:172 (+) Transcript_13110:760-1275(+)
MGDIHQPLHTTSRYTAEHPTGDKGGNSFPLKYHYKANELHAVWDNVVYLYHVNPKRPFTESSWGDFGAIATDLNERVKISSTEAHTVDFAQMEKESHAISLHVYDGLKEGGTVSQSYIDKYQPIAVKRVVLAAHRIVYLIEQLFGSSKTSQRVEASSPMPESLKQRLQMLH